MKAFIKVEKEVEIKSVRIEVAVRYGDEDIPYDFPLRKGDMWYATVDIDTGKIEDWPQGVKGNLEMKVCDSGTYKLFDSDGKEVASIESDYVPNYLIPGPYSDYIDLKINEDGVITNWPKEPDIRDFFQDE